MVKAEDFDKMEADYVRFKFRLSIPSLKFSFYNEFEQMIFQANIEE